MRSMSVDSLLPAHRACSAVIEVGYLTFDARYLRFHGAARRTYDGRWKLELRSYTLSPRRLQDSRWSSFYRDLAQTRSQAPSGRYVLSQDDTEIAGNKKSKAQTRSITFPIKLLHKPVYLFHYKPKYTPTLAASSPSVYSIFPSLSPL